MPTVALDESTFADTVHNNDLVLIDFWAEWCGPCRMFGPVYDKISEEFPDVVFAKVDTEDQPGLGQAFNITSIPTLMAIRDGVVLYSQPGALPEGNLRQLVTAVKDIDMDEVRAKIAAESDDAPQ
ncbi:MAG: thioredoxin [Candidatus Nanopelagicales bacterium]